MAGAGVHSGCNLNRAVRGVKELPVQFQEKRVPGGDGGAVTRSKG